METLYRTVVGFGVLVGFSGLGVALWAVVAPNEQRRKEMAKEHPKSSPLQYEEIQQQNAIVMAAIKEAAETNQNVARRQWPWHK